MNTPILIAHDASRPVGSIVDGVVTFLPGHELTEDEFFAVFGRVGVQFEETFEKEPDGIPFIRKARIFEWSVF